MIGALRWASGITEWDLVTEAGVRQLQQTLPKLKIRQSSSAPGRNLVCTDAIHLLEGLKLAALGQARQIICDPLAAGGQLRQASGERAKKAVRPADDYEHRPAVRGRPPGRTGQHVAGRVGRRNHVPGSRRHARRRQRSSAISRRQLRCAFFTLQFPSAHQPSFLS